MFNKHEIRKKIVMSFMNYNGGGKICRKLLKEEDNFVEIQKILEKNQKNDEENTKLTEFKSKLLDGEQNELELMIKYGFFKSPPKGIQNKGYTCWFNSIMQLFGRAIYSCRDILYLKNISENMKLLLCSLYSDYNNTDTYLTSELKNLSEYLNNQQDCYDMITLKESIQIYKNKYFEFDVYEKKIYSKCPNENSEKKIDHEHIIKIYYNASCKNLQGLFNSACHEQIIDETKCESGLVTYFEKNTTYGSFKKFLLLHFVHGIHFVGEKPTKIQIINSDYYKINLDEEITTLEKKKYKLIAYVSHIGAQPISGHYKSYLNFDNVWYECDDSIVKKINNRPKTISYVEKMNGEEKNSQITFALYELCE